MQRTDPDVVSVVYSGDIDASKENIISKVKARFDITLDPKLLHFVFLRSRWLVEDSTWPRFTLLGQSIGSMYLAWESMTQLIPDLYIGHIPIGAYVHYPTISTDMLARVKSRKKWHTNTDQISSSALLSRFKLLYYRLFMYYYVLSLRTSSFVMVNSSWTKNHVDSILRHSDPLIDALHMIPPLVGLKLFTSQNAPATARIVHPSCDTREMSVAQFRPEKDHRAQLNAFHRLVELHPEYIRSPHNRINRNDDDARRVTELQKLAKDLAIDVCSEYNDFRVNASIGLSTMVDEHFGINVASGVIPVAHASGGPLKDIIVPFNGERTGFHAKTTDEFAEALHTVLSLPNEEELAMRWRARAWAVQRFSEEEFERGWNQSGWRTWLSKSTSSR
ncbi:mannosyltransferase [Pholiota molesta]|nr:mannosyltransferase [Pholiota molesta]